MDRVERAAKNEALFREVNERVAKYGDVPAYRDGFTAAICECSDAQCTEVVELTLAEYESIRTHGERFAVLVGHEATDLERVVERNDRFAVVEKFGEGAEIARALDPR